MPGIASMLQIALAPAPAPVVEAVEEIVVESSLESASVFRIRLGIAQNDLGDWSFLQEDLFRPLTPITIRVAVGAVPLPEALLNGYVAVQARDLLRRGGQLDARDLGSRRNRADGAPGEGDALAEPARQRHRGGDLRPVHALPHRSADRTDAASSRRGRRSSAAPTCASCASSRGGTASTSTSSPSR